MHAIDAHGVMGGNTFEGTRSYEIYDNVILALNGRKNYANPVMRIRGGDGVIYGNLADTAAMLPDKTDSTRYPGAKKFIVFQIDCEYKMPDVSLENLYPVRFCYIWDNRLMRMAVGETGADTVIRGSSYRRLDAAPLIDNLSSHLVDGMNFSREKLGGYIPYPYPHPLVR